MEDPTEPRMLRKASLTQDLKDEQGIKESSVEKAFPGEKKQV